MNKAVMISIQKPHTDNIFSGMKKGEWRIKPLPKGKAYCYESKSKSKGCGKVIGEFDVVSVVKYYSADMIPPRIIEQGAVSKEFLQKYSKGEPLYWCRIANAVRYDKPKELAEFKKAGLMTKEDWLYALYPNTHCHYDAWAEKFKLTTPPQSWCYVTEE